MKGVGVGEGGGGPTGRCCISVFTTTTAATDSPLS